MLTVQERIRSLFETYRTPILIFLISRVVVFIAMAIIGHHDHLPFFCQEINARDRCLVAQWDSGKYLRIADHGYGQVRHGVPPLTYAFFPAYPMILRLLSFGSTMGLQVMGIALSFAMGLITSALLWNLFKKVLNESQAAIGIVIFWFLPMSFAMSLMYAEVLAIPAVAAALLALHQRKWAWTTLFACAAMLLKPQPGLIVVVVASLSLLEVFRTKKLRLLCVSAAALIAIVTPFLWLDRIAGVNRIWFKTQQYWWGQGVGVPNFPTPTHTDDFQVVFVFVLYALVLWLAIKATVPQEWKLYVLLVVASSTLLAHQYPRFRFFAIAFPAIAIIVARIPRRASLAFCGLLAVLGVYMMFLSLGSQHLGTV